MADFIHFDVPVTEYRTVGPCRERTCYYCRYLGDNGRMCGLFKVPLKPAFHRCSECKLAEAAAQGGGTDGA